MINVEQLRTCIIRPTLTKLGLWSQAAENLLLGTAAVESNLGTYIHQVRGPALGIYQMEPVTHDDIHTRFLSKDSRKELQRRILAMTALQGSSEELVGNLYYATAMTRIFYLRFPEPLPAYDDIEGMAKYWKKYYNTYLGAGTEQHFIDAYNRLVGTD